MLNIGIDIDDTIAKSLEATDFYTKEFLLTLTEDFD